MKTRKIGNLTVSSIGLGCMGMSGMYGSASEQEAIATIHKAISYSWNKAHFLLTGKSRRLGSSPK